MATMQDTVYDGLITLFVYLFDTLIPIFRKIRFFILLPFTPILKPITDYLFASIGIKVSSEMKGSHADICVLDKRFYARLWSDQELGFQEMYVEEWWTTENMDALYEKIVAFFEKNRWIAKAHIAYWEAQFRWALLNTGREGHNFSAPPEYDLPPAYFKLMTDKEHMQLSAGYYAYGATNYAEAQVGKLTLIAAKLGLKAGMTLLDLGCGYGGLSKFMADNYGVTVVGVTVCGTMAKQARKHCSGSNVTIKKHHWRKLGGKFDRITVIEMLEHVGKQNYDEFFRKIESLLNPGGQVLFQHYVTDHNVPHFSEFYCKYQFGQVYFPSFHEFVEPSSKYLRIANTQDLTIDASLTCQHYLDMVDNNRAEMEALVGPKVWRALRITYAIPFAHGKFGTLMIYQTVLVRKDEKSRVPLAQ
ncbi:cyclopropane-fatty-acyl-phospholipid synthase [Folsomia candida]|uniref:Cyclopropane-fatty-acyl-phospholipid synthase n=1 Tax=Folsomia candida TaxID=158441 RepID=A0A226DY14_FOLCA|nr:cyclopropane-fatty-acyl-phospholipid synthase [Folsomia candida]XP_035711276.1 cyclopropane-fatty-acyl-phospholipid synthase [Folsomia candida]OXA49597.1 Cyclopropane-fatty-acyl-phospholipid synthase [Folsomia candida]